MALGIAILLIVFMMGIALISISGGGISPPPMPPIPTVAFVRSEMVGGGSPTGPDCIPGDATIQCVYNIGDANADGYRYEFYDPNNGNKIGSFEYMQYSWDDLYPGAEQALSSRGMVRGNTRIYSTYIEVNPAYRGSGWGSTFNNMVDQSIVRGAPDGVRVVRIMAETSGTEGWTASYRAANDDWIIKSEVYKDIWLVVLR